jgi:phosphoribosylformylglycinamidine synthase
MHAVAECARKVACSGALPVAATNCLNFGNPEKPEIMAQLSAAIDGITEACIALGTPITGGNVSLYNETRGEGIYPTPVLGIVGILDDVTKAVPAGFQRAEDAILLLWPIPRAGTPDPNLRSLARRRFPTRPQKKRTKNRLPSALRSLQKWFWERCGASRPISI